MRARFAGADAAGPTPGQVAGRTFSDRRSGSPNRLLYTVFPTSGIPVAGNDHYETPAGTALALPVAELLAGDFDWGGTALSFVSAGQAVGGSVSVSGQTVTFTPNAGFVGDGSFTYTIRNAALQQDTATVRIQVGNLPLPPVAVDDALATAVGTAVQVTTATLLANDMDPDSAFSFYRIVDLPAHGLLALSGSTLTYTPDAGFSGIDRFTYRIRDPSGLSDVGTVDVRVGGVFGGALLRDQFTNVSPLRDPGDPLNGTRTEVGNFLWTAGSGAGFGTGIVTNIATAASVIGGVPFQPGSYPTATAARLEARVDSRAQGWTGVGFSFSATGGYWSHGQVWAFLRPSGRLLVRANGTTHALFDSPTPASGFVTGWNNIAIDYDWSDNTVRVWLNGIPQPLAVSDLDDVGFQPDVRYVGFHAHPEGTYPSTGQVGLDDYHLTLFLNSTRPEIPAGVEASWDLYSDRVRVSWDPVPGATGYRVYRDTSQSASPTVLPMQAAGAFLDDRTADPGVTYHYRVQAVNGIGAGGISSSDLGRRRSDGQTLKIFSPTADATARQTSPDSNFGTDPLLDVRYTTTGQGRFSFLRFDLSAISGAVESATLEVRVHTQEIPGISVYLADDLYWQESTLTWNNWDDCATPIFLWKSWELAASSFRYLDVTDAVRGNGSVTIGLATDFDLANRSIVSRDNAAVPYRPKLRVYVRGGSPTTYLLEPTADARVREAQPTSNFGTQDFLRVRSTGSGLAENSYLKFSIPGSGTVLSGSLRLRTQETPIARIDAYRVGTSTWTETGITWSNAPVDVTAHLGPSLSLPGNQWINVPLSTGSGGIQAAGIHTVGIVTNENLANRDFWSRESACRPRLEVVTFP